MGGCEAAGMGKSCRNTEPLGAEPMGEVKGERDSSLEEGGAALDICVKMTVFFCVELQLLLWVWPSTQSLIRQLTRLNSR